MRILLIASTMIIAGLVPAGQTPAANNLPNQLSASDETELKNLVRWEGKLVVTAGLPLYPQAAIDAGRSGKVEFELAVGSSGRILQRRQLTSSGEAFDAATLATLSAWKMAPFTNASGQAIPVRVFVEFLFRQKPQRTVSATISSVPETFLAPGVTEPIEVFTPDDLLRPPRVRQEQKPSYGSVSKRIQGDVTMDIVILADGRVGRVRVRKSLHPQLDKQAVLAASQWQFEPGTRDGGPVPVIAELVMAFNAH